MILAIGIDLVEIQRIREAMANPRFVQRILTQAERDYCQTPAQVAGRWAAKEALAKCIPDLVAWQDVEILPGMAGRPEVTFVQAGHLAPGQKVHISISHERGSAVAVAVLEALTIP